MALVLVCEGPDDHRILSSLILNVLQGQAAWIEPEHFNIRGAEETDPYLAWHSVDKAHQDCFPGSLGMSSLGKFGGKAALPYAKAARRALQVLTAKCSDGDGFILVCDEDIQNARRLDGLRQAREESGLASRVAVGVASPKIEAWVLAGFEAQTESEKASLQIETARLSFDPTRKPERIRSQASGDTRDIKRVLNGLSGGDHEREALAAGNLGRIREHGRESGAAHFIGECQERIAPLFGAAPQRN